MRIRTKTLLAATLIGAAILVAGVAVLAPVETARSRLADLHSKDAGRAMMMSHVAYMATTAGDRFLATGDTSERTAFDVDLAQLADIEGAFQDTRGRSGDNREDTDLQLLGRITAGRTELAAVSARVFDQRTPEGRVSPAAYREYTDASTALQSAANALFDKEAKLSSAAEEELSAIILRARTVMYTLGGVGFFAALVLGWIMAFVIIQPIERLRVFAEQVAAGHLEAECNMRREDEVGHLADSLRRMQVNLRESVRSLEAQIEERRLAQDVLQRTSDELTHLNVDLATEVEEHRRADAALTEANRKLVGSVDSLEIAIAERTLLSEMGEILQADLSSKEAHEIIAGYAQRLFGDTCGALYTMDIRSGSLLRAATFGEGMDAPDAFTAADCWALRSGRPHTSELAHPELRCAHFAADITSPAVCVPLVAHGDTVGSFTVCLPGAQGSAIERGRPGPVPLAMRFSELIALSLSNLSLRETLREQSVRDTLTGLFNRRYLEESLAREVARAQRSGASLGVLMMDVDHFKRVNDEHGHDAGDVVLSTIGALLMESIRSEDIACRYGGEELLLVLPGAALDAVRQRAEQLRSSIERLLIPTARHGEIGVTVSIGVAVMPEHGSTTDELMRSADTALYVAKESGRNLVVVGQERSTCSVRVEPEDASSTAE